MLRLSSCDIGAGWDFSSGWVPVKIQARIQVIQRKQTSKLVWFQARTPGLKPPPKNSTFVLSRSSDSQRVISSRRSSSPNYPRPQGLITEAPWDAIKAPVAVSLRPGLTAAMLLTWTRRTSFWRTRGNQTLSHNHTDPTTETSSLVSKTDSTRRVTGLIVAAEQMWDVRFSFTLLKYGEGLTGMI